MITLDRPAGVDGTVLASLDGAQAGELRDHFERLHWVLIPGLIGSRLLEEVRERLDAAAFVVRADEVAGELKLDERSELVARLLFILNDPAVYRAVEAATGIDRFARFDGRIYRKTARPEHYQVWHDDVAGAARMVGMSVNLGAGSYEGGVLKLRRKGTTGLLGQVHNTGPGDALLFRIRPELQHRVTSVTGGTKTALAGWFGSAPPWPLPHRV